MADAGKPSAGTAATLSRCEQTVLHQRKRFLERRSPGALAALRDLPRNGRPRTHTETDCAQVVAVVCETLLAHESPLSSFGVPHPLPIVRQGADLAQLSASTLARILGRQALKRWRYRYWLYPHDPEFVPKACRVLDLYARLWLGQTLGPYDYVISADEKIIQILLPCHPGQPAALGYRQRVESEYARHGTVAYHSAWDVHRGRILGRTAPATSSATFVELIDLVMLQEPYRNAARAFWIADGGCAHHPSTFPGRLQTPYANAIAVPLPTHAS